MKIKNEEVISMLSMWRPALGNVDDIEIYSLLKLTKKKTDKSNHCESRMRELLEKRIKEGAVKSSFK